MHIWWTPRSRNGEAGLTEYQPTAYGDALGSEYDALYPDSALDTDGAVAFLAGLAQARPERSFVEFGVGTGRLALAVQERGIRVAGIDASQRMVDELRRKPGGERVDVTIGDYVTARVPGTFAVVAIVFNNILDPRGRQAQLALFRNAARHLSPGGCFVVEAFVLSDAQRSGEWFVHPRHVGHDHAELQLARYDIATNEIERTLLHLRPDRVRFHAVRDTYASPGELDVMAEVTGFRLLARHASWRHDTFTSASARHVSVYELDRLG